MRWSRDNSIRKESLRFQNETQSFPDSESVRIIDIDCFCYSFLDSKEDVMLEKTHDEE